MKKHFKTNRSFKDVIGILTIRHLAYILGEKPQILQQIAAHADKYYHPFIDRRGKKPRKIDRPTGVIKDVQTKICDRLLEVYPLCGAVYGAVVDRDTRLNAQQHVGQRVVVRIDLKDCFHSTKKKWVYHCFRTRYRYSHPVAKLLTELCTFQGSVPVGSPLSSMLINVVYDPLWRKVEAFCTSENHKCTVWVDDVVISGDHADTLISRTKSLINDRGLRIGWNKLEIQRGHKEAQEVTGNTVNSEVGIPMKKRREYAKILQASQIDEELIFKARGKLEHVRFVNKRQGKQLRKLIGEDVKSANNHS